MFNALENGSPRILMEVDLQPVQGEVFQSTGFPDIGSAVYNLPDGTRKLIVESAQSMANRLEETIVGDGGLIPELEGLSYVQSRLTYKPESKAKEEKDFEWFTSSLVEPHRLGSPYILGKKEENVIRKAFKEMELDVQKQWTDWPRAAAIVFKYDVNSLIHGAFLVDLSKNLRFSRLLTGFIEATDVNDVIIGGVKNNMLDPSGTYTVIDGNQKDVYSNVPYQRVFHTAGRITAYFALDIDLLNNYQLGEDASRLLVALALYKVRRFLDGNMRLRSNCTFRTVGPVKVTEPDGFELPAASEILPVLKNLITKCRPMFADKLVTEVEVGLKKGSKNNKAGDNNAENTD